MSEFKKLFFIFCAKYLIFFLIGLTGIFVNRLLKEKQKPFLIRMCITLPIIFIIAKISSYFYFDPRPFVVGNFVPLIPHAPDNGFPSDHMLLASALAALVLSENKKVGWYMCAIAMLIGASRIIVGVHHPADILGSMVIAGCVTWILYAILHLCKKLFPKKLVSS